MALSALGHYVLVGVGGGRDGGAVFVLESGDRGRRWRVSGGGRGWEALLERVVEGLEEGRWTWEEGREGYEGEGADGFCGVWEEGGREWEEKKEGAVRSYDESVLTALTRDL